MKGVVARDRVSQSLCCSCSAVGVIFCSQAVVREQSKGVEVGSKAECHRNTDRQCTRARAGEVEGKGDKQLLTCYLLYACQIDAVAAKEEQHLITGAIAGQESSMVFCSSEVQSDLRPSCARALLQPLLTELHAKTCVPTLHAAHMFLVLEEAIVMQGLGTQAASPAVKLQMDELELEGYGPFRYQPPHLSPVMQ